MIKIVPSIAVIKGQCVHVDKANFNKVTKYDVNPLEVAQKFEAHGIDQIHMVDLEGAKKGHPVNYGVLETIAGYTNLQVDFSGGITTDGDISKAYEYGASYITAASVAVSRKDLFTSWLVSYGREKITLGADALQGKILIRGWQKNTDIDVADHIGYFYERGLKYVKTTDVSRDGEMSGPSLELYKQLLERYPGLCILASGGISSIEDIEKLQDIGVWGVIFNKAFYEDKIRLKDLERFTQKATS
ncbi:histidine biosynthesis protein [Flammeovirgaceae bacterium 311]|nr:histidine biosynthesis protein [Flammeovirgaceae bacterium 311]